MRMTLVRPCRARRQMPSSGEDVCAQSPRFHMFDKPRVCLGVIWKRIPLLEKMWPSQT